VKGLQVRKGEPTSQFLEPKQELQLSRESSIMFNFHTLVLDVNFASLPMLLQLEVLAKLQHQRFCRSD
tara:strand:- start:413 stop:616 length:204 start_codon:yes stop_codon:yes gene_type:complete